VSLVNLPPYKVRFDPSILTHGVDWGLSAYNIPALWSQTKGQGITVAVIDSGVADHTHLVCEHHVNFTTDSETQDTLGHGTHVAGIIGATGGKAKGIAPEASLMSLKALGHSGFGNNSHVAEAIRYAADHDANIICMSLGGSKRSEEVADAIKYSSRKGVIHVCAAGNDSGPVNYPAALYQTIAVGAVDAQGHCCEFSCRGEPVVVAAPGENITSTWLNNGYATISGTSMAAPFVAGVLALYLSACKSKGTCTDILYCLATTASDVGESGKDPLYGWGLINPGAMLKETEDIL